jgi:folate-binding protein YgfZ
LQTHTPTDADQVQLNALENGCGAYRWDKATLVQHSGPDALDLLHRLTTKELLSVTEGRSQRTALTSDRGRVVDVFLVAHVGENQLLLISDSSDSERTVSAIDYYTIIEDAELTDISDSHTRISLVGPKSQAVVSATFESKFEIGTVMTASFSGKQVSIASDTSRGVVWTDVICESEIADQLAETLESDGGISVDSNHFKFFSIQNEIPGSDREYGEHSNPIEAGLLHLIDWDKGCYVGQEVIARLDAYDKVQRNVKVLESDVPLVEGTKLTVGSKPAGVVTSASDLKATTGNYLSLALVRKAFFDSGTNLDADGVTALVR